MKKEALPKKVIIIGAGVSGLSAGIYGQKHGFITEIYEKNPNNGGLCFSWERKGYPIDGCIHWLTGTKEGTDINKMWHDVDAFDQEDIIYEDNFGSVFYKGKTYTFWCDLKKLEKELIEISPKDKRRIHQLIKYINKFYNMPLPMDKPLSAMNLFDFLRVGFKMIPYLFSFLYATRISQAEFAAKFKSEDLRYIISKIVPGDGNLYTTLYAFGTVAFGNGGVPRGGSLSIIKRMEEEYIRCGGIIHNNSEVESLITKDKIVTAIKLKNGKEIVGDYFVTACDAFEATRKIVSNSKHDKHLTKRFIKKDKYPLPSCVYCSFVADKKIIKKLGITTIFEFETKPFKVGRKTETTIKMRNYLYDESFVKNGKVLLTVLLHQTDKDYYYWEKQRENYTNYLKLKKEIADTVKERIILQFPSLENNIETIDVTTPTTYNRYVNAHRGAYMPWSYTDKGHQLMHNSSVPGLKNLIFSGQWTIMPGGLPIALMSGKFAIQHVLKKEHRSIILTKKYKLDINK